MLLSWLLLGSLAKYGYLNHPTYTFIVYVMLSTPRFKPSWPHLEQADNPDEVDYFTLNKEQPLHLNINVDSDQVGLDNKEFQDKEDDEAVPKENITLEDEEKLKATESPLSKVHIS